MTSAIQSPIIVPPRFSGPPSVGNGGYCCGLVAATLAGSSAVECTIRKPIPVGRELVLRLEPGRTKLFDGEELVIEGVSSEFTIECPFPVTFAEADAAAKRSPAFQNHPFPTCFVCGPQRPDQDGLRVYPGPVESQEGFPNLYAAPWVPALEFAEQSGTVRAEIIWAALDCPTGFAAGFPYEGKLVTGRLAVKLLRPVTAGEECVLMSWSLGSNGRKCHSAAVLVNSLGLPCAEAKATWIRLT
jgi:hypothetical protein